MASKSTFWSKSLLELLFNGTAIANIAQNNTVSPLSNLYVSLHTASPGVNGNQNTNEASYAGYARVPVQRNSGGWVMTDNSISPASTIIFPTATAGAETETFVGIGVATTGIGPLLYFGSVSPVIPVVVGVGPQLNAGSVISEA